MISWLDTRLKRAQWALNAIFLIHGLVVATWASRIPSIKAGLAMGDSLLGLSLLGSAVGTLVAMPLSARLLPRLGSQPLVMISTLLFALTLPGLGVAPSVFWLTVALFGFGLSAGTMDVAMNAHAITLEKACGRSLMIGFHALFSVGAIAASGLGSVLTASHWSTSWHFLLVAGVVAISLPGLAPALLPPHEDRLQPPSPQSSSLKPSLGWRVRLPLIGLCVMGFCSFLAEGAMIDWSGIYLVEWLQAPPSLAPLGYGIFSLSMAGGRLAGDRLADRHGPARMILLSTAVAALGLLLMVLAPSVLWALMGLLVAGLGFSPIVPLVFSGAGRLSTDEADKGRNLAIVNLFSYGAFLLGPTSIGLLSDWIGLRVTLSLLIALCALAALASRFSFPAKGLVVFENRSQ